MVFRLHDHDITFPDPSLADDDGLLAIGGDLSPERLVRAYKMGIFPWYEEGDPICWYAPHERFVLYPSELKLSRSMARVIASAEFVITFNKAFHLVISECSSISRKGQQGTWITPAMKDAYIRLHGLGFAHSVEAWKDGELAGGLYGVNVNKVFCGESMFSRYKNASKAVLIALSKEPGLQMIDCQVYTTHLESMGARLISSAEFREALEYANQ